MRKFFILLRKEIRELLTPQILIPFLMVILIFYFFGRFASREAQKSQGPQTIAVLDQDQSALSENLLAQLAKANFDVKLFTDSQPDLPSLMKKNGLVIGLVIPVNFEKSVQNFSPEKIPTYSLINNFSVISIGKYSSLNTAVATINNFVSNGYLAAKVPKLEPALLKNPIQATDFSLVKNSQAQVSATAVLGYLSTQTNFVPVILFLVIIIAAQMVATSIASEKENKTLETLLTAPLNRKMVVVAKMVGAGVVGFLMAGVYLFGFRSFIGGFGGASAPGANLGSSLQELGLVLSPVSFLLLGLVVFLGILVALSIAIILGAFAEDVKGVQGTITPLMVLMLIPYFASLLLDVNSLPVAARYLFYAIPFSHIFLAMPNLYLHNNQMVIFGALYELVVFVVFVWLAARIFSTDKIITLKINFGRKRK